ncbi:hypothetical protein ACFW04_010214 [Cataglyphis niger]
MAQPTPLNIVDNILIGTEDLIDDKCINIGELLLNAFKSRPDFIGQVDAIIGEENTFQQMRERSVKCALWLKKIGVQRNDIVTVCTSNRMDAYIPYLASLYIGAILSVWPDNRIGNLRYFIQSRPKVIFTDINKAPLILNVTKIMNVSTKIVVFKKKCEEEERFESLNSILNNDFDEDEIDKFSCTKLESSKDTAVILFSSGSIDRIRKHVTIPHSFFTSPSNQQIPFMTPNETGLWVETLHWNISLLLTVRCILSYVKAVKVYRIKESEIIYENYMKMSFPALVRQYEINWIFLKNSTIYNLNVNFFKSCNIPCFKQMILGCKVIPYIYIPPIVAALPEAYVTVVYCLPEVGIIAFHRFIIEKNSIISFVSKNVSLFFADFNTESPLKPYQYGFIRCKSPCLTNGYFDPLTRHIHAAVDNGWFYTETVGFYNKDNIFVMERGKAGQVISYRNYRFSPLILEDLLYKHPAIMNAAVVPIYNIFDNHHPMALIVRKENVKVTEKEIIEYVAAKVKDDRKHLRAGVLFVDNIPIFLSGNCDRRKTCEQARKYSTNSFKIEDNILIGKEAPIDECINIGESILNAFKSKPDFVGQVDGISGEESTYRQMRESSIKCALWMKKFGIQRNDIVTLCTYNYFDAYIPFLASLYIGATLTIWNEYRPINYRHYMQSNPKIIFTDTDKVASILNVANMLGISTKIIVLYADEVEKKDIFECLQTILDEDVDEAEIDEFSCIKLESSKDTAVILFSAGTIGDVRKHVTIPHIFFTSPSNQHVPVISPNDVGMWIESLHWHISLLLTVRCILSYVKAIKLNEFYPSLERSFCNTIEKYKVTWVFLKINMSNHFSHFKFFKNYNISSLKQIIFGGRFFISPKIFEKFIISLQNVSVIQVYCLPEVGMITYQEKTGKYKSSGYVCNNVSLVITSYSTGFALDAGNLGIIQCKSPCLTNCCFSYLPTDLIPFPDNNNGWFCTDDVGYYSPDGELYVLDRKQNIIQYRSCYFLPSEIEEVLLKHPKVEKCAVIPLYNIMDVHHPLAFVVPNEDAKIMEQEIIQFASDNLHDCMKLRGGVLFRYELKYLRNGQLDRRTLYKWAKDDLKDKAFFLKKASKKKT